MRQMAGSSTAEPPGFFFDLASPAAYLAAERALQVLPGVEWVPVLARELPGAAGIPGFRARRPRETHYPWMSQPSAARPASMTASLSVGWPWMMRASSG